jgi:hypothetical protein
MSQQMFPEPPSFALKGSPRFSADFRHLSTFLVSIPRFFLHVLTGLRGTIPLGEFFLLYTDGSGVPGCHSTKWAASTSKFDNAPGHHQRPSEHAEASPADDRLRFPKQEFGTSRDGEGSPADHRKAAGW